MNLSYGNIWRAPVPWLLFDGSLVGVAETDRREPPRVPSSQTDSPHGFTVPHTYLVMTVIILPTMTSRKSGT
jgi:hypothetical protein